MEWIDTAVFIAALTVGAAAILYFWWECVKAACRDLAREWKETLRDFDTKHSNNKGGDSD